jgi:transposase
MITCLARGSLLKRDRAAGENRTRATTERKPMEAGVAPPSEVQQVCVELTPEERAVLRKLAAERGIPESVVLREALLEKGFFADHRRTGEKIVIQSRDGKLSPVQWSY